VIDQEGRLSRFIFVLCLASCGWGFSFGAGAPLASLWLKDAGCSDAFIGLNTAAYYLGIAAAAGFIPPLMRRFRAASPVAGMAAAALTVAIFPFGQGTAAWFGLRILNGFAGALSIIPMETLINRHSRGAERSQNFGYYAFSMAIGIASGELLGLQLYSSAPYLAFALGGLGPLLAAIAVHGWLQWPVEIAQGQEVSAPLGLVRNFLCFGSAWSQGFLEGGMMGLMPVYLLALGLSDAGIGWMMSGVMLGVIAFQVPVAWLADRVDRRGILLGCYAATVSALAVVLWGVGLVGLALCLFMAAACSTAFYPLGLSLLGERVPLGSHDRANAWYLGINCLGSLTGPALSGLAMDRFGNQALIASGLGAVVFVLIVVAGLHFLRKPALPELPAVEARRAA
jgi:MFS family permease